MKILNNQKNGGCSKKSFRDQEELNSLSVKFRDFEQSLEFTIAICQKNSTGKVW